MHKTMRLVLIFLPFVILLFFLVFSGNELSKLKKEIRKSTSDNKIDNKEFESQIKFLLSNKEEISSKLSNLYIGDSVNKKEYIKFVRSCFEEQKQSGLVIEAEEKTNGKLRFFIDNSGSMDGYVNGNTDFKDILTELLVKLSYYYGLDKIDVNMINKDIFPIMFRDDKDIRHLMAYLTPSCQNWVKGDKGRQLTKLNEMFEKVLNSTQKDDISFFISDCIYSLDNGQNTIGRLNYQKSLTTSCLLDKLNIIPELGIILLHFNSNFDGNYTTIKNQRLTVKWQRPFYIIVVTRQEYIKDIIQRINFSSLKNFNHWFLFSNSLSTPNYYSILESSDVIGRFKTDHKKSSNIFIHGIEDVKADNQGRVKFMMATNFTGIAGDDRFLMDNNNYEVSNGFQVVNVERFQDAKIDNNDRKMVQQGNPTHIISINCPHYNSQEKITLGLKNKLPEWVDNTSIDDDGNLQQYKEKTFGLKYFTEGILEAYKIKNSKNTICEFLITIK